MSIILDALRKSENERRRQERPGLSQLPPALPRPTVPAWVFTTLGALATLVVVLAIAFWRLSSDPADIPVAAPAPMPATPVPATAEAPRMALADPVEPAAAAPPDPQPVADTRPLSREVPPAPTPRPAATGPSADASDLPSLDELTAMGEFSVPDLHMDLHVYATDPAQRFVFINGRRLRHGDEFAGSLRVIEILADGVILEHDGRRFVLPRD